jgi:hypothetical protein
VRLVAVPVAVAVKSTTSPAASTLWVALSVPRLSAVYAASPVASVASGHLDDLVGACSSSPLVGQGERPVVGVVAATASFVTILAAFRLPAVGATNATCEVVALTVPSGTMIGRLFATIESFGGDIGVQDLVRGHARELRAPTVPMVPAPPGAQS